MPTNANWMTGQHGEDEDYVAVVSPHDGRIVDVCHLPGPDPECLARLRDQYGPELTVIGFAEALSHLEDKARTEPYEITRQDFMALLTVLPPQGWVREAGRESFKLAEPIVLTIVSIQVRIGERYFSFNDRIGLPHEACCQLVLASRAYRCALGDCENEIGNE